MPTRRKPVKKKKPTPRWNDAPPRRNPLGLLIILAGACGLFYASCGPRENAHTAKPAHTASTERETPPVPRMRYEQTKPVQVVEAPKVVEEPVVLPDPEQKADVEGPAGAPDDVPAPGKTIEEPEVQLGVPPAANVKQPEPRPKAVVAGEFERNPNATGMVALTFDGCYENKPLPRILAALDQYGYKATFFLAGRFAEKYPQSVKRIANDGMEVGNHSWSHPKFTILTDSQIDKQLSRTNERLRELSGQTSVLFRPPFGDRDARVRRLVAANGFRTVCWALDSYDSVKKGITSEEIARRVLAEVKPGDVVLLHIGSEATADALPTILEGLASRDIKVVPVSVLMKG